MGDMSVSKTAWDLCPYYVLRSPGFAFGTFLEMSFRRAPGAIDRVIRLQATLAELAPRLKTYLDTWGRIAPRPAPAPRLTPPAVRKKQQRRLPIPDATVDLFPEEHRQDWLQLLDSWNRVAGALRPAIDTARELMESELWECRQALRQLCGDERIRDAMWISSQNFTANFERYLAAPLGRRVTKARQLERTAMLFLQRLTAKNDTISFFGPYVWGRFRPDSAVNLRYQPGAGGLIRRSLASCEYWGMAVLARRISAEREVWMELCPYLKPSCHLEGTTLRYPIGHRRELGPRQAAVLRLADGSRTSRQLLADLGSDPLFAGQSPAEIEALYRDLIARQVLVCQLTVPTATPNSERLLLERLQELPRSCPRRDFWVGQLQQFCDWVREYSQAAAPRRREIVHRMNQRFRELTGEEPNRRAGEMYAARTLLYEDCERNVERCEVGGELLRELRSLAPIFELARWITLELPRRYQDRFAAVYRQLAGNGSRPPVDFLAFLHATDDLGAAEDIERQLYRELQDAWRQVLADRFREDCEEVVITPEECERVLDLLPEGGTAGSRLQVVGHSFHSPDFLFIGRDIEAINRGEFRIVMGEIHKSTFMVTMPWAMPFCRFEGEIRAFLQESLEGPIVEFSDPPMQHIRANINWPLAPQFYEIVTDARTSRYPPEQVIPVGELQVVEEAGDLFVETRDRRQRIWLPSVLRYFHYRKYQHSIVIDPLPALGGQHSPRLVFGSRIILQRRRWRFGPEDLPQVDGQRADSMELWMEVRAWQQRKGLPRLIFLKVPREPKPVLIDFDNFISVELFLRLVRASAKAVISEMSPGPAHLWLHDAAGERYVSEIRTTVVYRQEVADAV